MTGPICDPHHAPAQDEPVFALNNLCFSVPERRLIDGLTLTIGSGVTALIGRNGSSKSTLLNLLAAQTRPSSGEIRYRGRPLQGWSPRTLARDLAFLPQITPPTEGLRLRELVALGRYPWTGALSRLSQQDHNTIHHAITQCGLSGLSDRIVETLSGGERQRGWIAMMLAQGAQTLLLDEPISALDIGHQIEVLRLLHDTAAARGLAVVVVLHDVNMALRFCDHVVALDSGKIVHAGPIETLLDPVTLRAIYGVDMHVASSPAGAFVQPT